MLYSKINENIIYDADAKNEIAINVFSKLTVLKELLLEANERKCILKAGKVLTGHAFAKEVQKILMQIELLESLLESKHCKKYRKEVPYDPF